MTRCGRAGWAGVALALVACLLAAPSIAAAQDAASRASSVDLVERPRAYDGTVVEFEGEAIGEAMVRGTGAWVHLNDDAYEDLNVEEGAKLGGYNSGMPVWMSAADARRIQVFGDYKHAGDIVRVTGVFNAACAEHGGDMDIHATSVEIVRVGHEADDPVKPWKVPTALGLTVLAGAAWVANRRVGHLESRGMRRR